MLKEVMDTQEEGELGFKRTFLTSKKTLSKQFGLFQTNVSNEFLTENEMNKCKIDLVQKGFIRLEF